MTETILEVENLCKNFGSLAVTRDVSITLCRGDRLGLIGPNGAGKSTLINLLTGVHRPTSGRVIFKGRDVTGLSTMERVRLGLVRTHQLNTLIVEDTPLGNVALAVSERTGTARRLWDFGGAWAACEDEAAGWLGRMGLDRYARTPCAELPYGAQRLLEVAIALAMEPEVLLLDEPAAGVPASEARLLESVLGALPPEIAVIIIDHDVDLVFRYSSAIAVLADGALLARGAPAEIARNAEVQAIYLGKNAA